MSDVMHSVARVFGSFFKLDFYQGKILIHKDDDVDQGTIFECESQSCGNFWIDGAKDIAAQVFAN